MKKKITTFILAIIFAVLLAFGANSVICAFAADTNTNVSAVKWQDNNMLTFTLSKSDYNGLSTSIVGKKYAEYNFSSSVKLYADYYGKTEAKTLDDYRRGDGNEWAEIYYNMWGLENTFSVSLFADKFSAGAIAVKRIEISAGTEFPAYAYTGAAAFGSSDYSTPTASEKTSFVTVEKNVFIINEAGNFVPESEWTEPAPFEDYEAGKKYDGSAEFLKKQSVAPTGYETLNFIPFNEFTDFATTYMGDTGDSLTAGSNMAKNTWLELDFVHPIDSAEFEKVVIGMAGHNTGGSKELEFEAYNAYKLKKDRTIAPVKSFSVKFWSVGTNAFQLSDFADENGSVDKIVFRITSDYTEQQLFITDFSLEKKVPLVEISGSVPDKIHIRGWLNDEVTGEPLPLENRNDAHCQLIFFLSETVCEERNEVVIDGKTYRTSIAMDANKLYDYNTLDYVILTIVESDDTASYNGIPNGDGTKNITLREAFEWNGWGGSYKGREAYYTVFGEGGEAVGYEIGNLLGTDVKKITILEGCQFPYYDYTNNSNPTEQKALVQVQTIEFTDTAPHQTFAIGWRPVTNKGAVTVNSVSYNQSGNDNILTFELNGVDYPESISDIECGLELAFPNDECYRNIVINGKKLYWYFENGDEQMVSVLNRGGGKNTFSLNVSGLTKDDKVTSVIIKAGCRIPAYANKREGIKAYGVCYFEIEKPIAFILNEATGKLEATDEVYWTVKFGDGTEIEVKNGTAIPSDKYPAPTEINGKIFKGWYENGVKWRDKNIVDDDVTLVAEYDDVVTVSFDTNGGNTIKSQTIIIGGYISYVTPEKNGAEFAGWYTDKNLTREFDRYSEVTEGITLYAKWVTDGTTENKTKGCGGSVATSIGVSATFVSLFAAIVVLTTKKKEKY